MSSSRPYLAAPSRGRRPERRGPELMQALFKPQSVMIVGGSDDPRKLSGRTQSHLRFHGYEGQVFVVNPKRDVVQGAPSYSSVAEVPAGVDLAIVALPAPVVANALREVAAAGVGVAVVFASGFAEAGADGERRQAELLDVRAETGLRIVGPNCIGVIDMQSAFTGTFSALLGAKPLLPGSVAFVTQSGAFGTLIFDAGQGGGIGFSHFANTGNELDVTVPELAIGLLEQAEVRTLLMYMEGVSDGEAMLNAARKAHDLDKPIVCVKAGRTEAGARAAASHTASLAGEDAVFDALATQHGLLRVSGMEPLLDAARVFSNGRRARGKRLAIVTVSGGAGILMADSAQDHGLEVTAWPRESQARLTGLVPDYGSTVNPIDVTATLTTQPGTLESVLQIVCTDPNTDAVAVMLGSGESTAQSLLDGLNAAFQHTEKPIVVVWAGASEEPRRRLAAMGIPAYPDPTRAIAALGLLVRWSTRTPLLAEAGDPSPMEARTLAEKTIAIARSQGRLALDEHESKRLLAAYGVPCAREFPARSSEEAIAAADQLGYPVCVKVLSATLVHKSDIGGVQLGLTNPAAVAAATEELLSLAAAHDDSGPRVLVQQMASTGVELIVGSKCDPTFGQIVAVGLGGLLAELIADVQLGRAPVTRHRADTMLDALRGGAVLHGTRGRPGVDRDAVIDTIVAISRLADDMDGQIAEIDVNPLVAHTGGATAVDGLVILR